MHEENYKASVTVFLSMIMFLLIGLVMSLVEVGMVHNMKVHRRVAAEGAMDSVFAEYHVGLREDYGLFGLDGSYKTGNFSIDNVLQRFTYYGGSGDESHPESIQLMTDNQGLGFLDQVVHYMKERMGMDVLEEVWGQSQQWDSVDIETGSKGETGLSDLINMKDKVTEEVENPLASLLDLDIDGILNLVVAEKDRLSDVKVDVNQFPSNRQLERGYGSGVSIGSSDVIKKSAMIEYALKILENANHHLAQSQTYSSETLKYQVEYLLGGKDSDKENLKAVVHKLLLLRTPVNYACLQGDSVKKAEVQVLATSIALATGAVGMESAIGESLLWAWSYGESIMDVKSLLSGYKIALTKSSNQWQLDLSGLLNLGDGSLSQNNSQEGMDYADFLRVLLYGESLDTLTMGTIDMVESSLRDSLGAENFHIDHCISRLELQIKTEVGMGYSYSFPIIYGYR